MEQILWKPIHADYVCFPDCHDHISLRQKRSGQSLKGTSSLLLQGKKTSKLKRQLDHKKKKFCIVKNYNFTLTPFQMFWACVLDSESHIELFSSWLFLLSLQLLQLLLFRSSLWSWEMWMKFYQTTTAVKNFLFWTPFHEHQFNKNMGEK